MIAAFDSSALVKLFMHETGTETARRLWDGAESLVSSTLAYPETLAALAAAARRGRLSGQKHQQAVREFGLEWQEVESVALGQGIAARAGDLAGRFSLSGADAVHLATALAIGEDEIVFATWDGRLSDAARDSGLAVLP